MAKTSTPVLPEKTNDASSQAPEWMIQNLLRFSKSLEIKAAKSGQKVVIHKN
jgi:hypothetical protein